MHGDPRIALPPKTEVYNSIEGMIAHFKIIMDGIHVPSGRGVLVHRGRQRRAGLLPRLRRDRAALEVPRAPPLLSGHRRPDQGAARALHRRRRPDLRHDQHDRRGMRHDEAKTDDDHDTAEPDDETVTVIIDGKTPPGPQGDDAARGLQPERRRRAASSATTPASRRPPSAGSAWSTSRVSRSRSPPATRRWPTRWR